MSTRSGYRRISVVLFTLFLLAMATRAGLAAAPTQAANASTSTSPVASSLPYSKTTPLVQCDLGLAMPLLLVGLAVLGGRAAAHKKK